MGCASGFVADCTITSGVLSGSVRCSSSASDDLSISWYEDSFDELHSAGRDVRGGGLSLPIGLRTVRDSPRPELMLVFNRIGFG
jgi:hypothetical protein